MKRSDVKAFLIGVPIMAALFVGAAVGLTALVEGGAGMLAELAAPGAWLCVVVFALFCAGMARFTRSTGGVMAGRMVTVRGHSHAGRHPGGRKHRASRHEAGHAAAARRLGKLRSAEVYVDGTGLVRAFVPDAESAVAFLLAGQIAHGSGEGAGGDNAAIRETLREFPAAERAAVRARAKATARTIVRRDSGQIRRDAKTLDTKGQL